MLRLVKAETYKLFKSKAFRVLCIIALLLGLLITGLSKLMSSEDFVKSSLKGMPEEQQQQYIKQLESSNGKDSTTPEASGAMGFSSNSKDIFHPKAVEIFHSAFGNQILEILLAVLIGALVAGEYSSGTIKNILAYGKKREYYYISKLFALTIGTVIMLGIMVGVATISSTAMFGWGRTFDIYQAANILKTFAAALIVAMTIISLLMLLATLLKNSGSTIGIGIVIFAIIPSVIMFLYGKFAWFDKIYEGTPAYNWHLVTSINSGNGDILQGIVVSLAVMVIATACGIMVFKKQDIK